MARRACIQALNEQPQNASRQVEREEEEKVEEEGKAAGTVQMQWTLEDAVSSLK